MTSTEQIKDALEVMQAEAIDAIAYYTDYSRRARGKYSRYCTAYSSLRRNLTTLANVAHALRDGKVYAHSPNPDDQTAGLYNVHDYDVIELSNSNTMIVTINASRSRYDSDSAYGIDGCLYHQCDYCSEWACDDDDESETPDGYWHYCSADCAYNSGWNYCDHCGEWVHEDDAVYGYSSYGDVWVYCSETCAINAGYRLCDECGQWHDDGIYTRDDRYLCEECASYSHSYCEECGDWVPNDEMATDCICNDCYGPSARPEHGETVYNRHNRPVTRSDEQIHQYGYNDPIRLYGDGSKHPYLGVELEVDKGRDCPETLACTLAHTCDANLFWLTYDGSLNCGLEIGAQPMTLDYHIASGLWGDVRDACLHHGYTSHNAGTCGLHIHINRDYFGDDANYAGYMLTLITQRFAPELKRFTRRDSDYWCSYFRAPDFTDRLNWQDVCARRKGEIACDNHGHSVAVNMEHSNTFEMRIFRGTLNITTLYASLALVDGLARYVRTHTEDNVFDLTWNKLACWILATCDNPQASVAFRDYLITRRLLTPARAIA